ncbi:MAG: zinc-binding alcohol dehydrogenase [Kaiparowitsia implicata GSE-PSE-MK54-09C]|jgi:threonine dehydrogenase-like Zn-dependent dehydrogenase|nr:zinc-binding alcohol dehydrogenase [Kaiparowitsia implicata GSE-PSE-MK54-09C]
MSERQIRSLGIEREGEAYTFPYGEGDPPDGYVRLETLYTGFSAGTELTFMKHTNPYFHSRWDADRGVFIAGEPSLDYPVPFLGYMEVARVTESRTPSFGRGQIVATTFGHKTGHTADPARDVLIPMPADLDPILGIFVAQMGPIAANGILHSDAEHFGPNVARLGQSLTDKPVLVIGAGSVGLMTALFARRAGASEIVVADPSSFRRARLEAMGLVAMEEEQAWQHVRTQWHSGGERGADVVFQTRAHAGSLHTALRALRPQGTVIDLAFYQGGAEALRLGEEFHHNGLAIRCAQINRVPRGMAHLWDRKRLALETVDLLRQEAPALLRETITHIVPFNDAPAFLSQLVKERPDFMQIVIQVAE